MFHCFGCKKGGDIFAFWMEYHKVSFSQAVKDLAQRYHVTLPERKLTPSQRRKLELREELFIINESAAKYYNHVLMKADRGLAGREYLEKRGLNKDIIDSFMLGYAPDEWDSLTDFLKGRRVDMGKAVKAGLILPKKSGGYYDRFRGRVLFPIYNIKGQVAGFGGRVLDESLPKYLNTPETPIFQKGELLYGLHAAYQAIREKGRVVIVEGYTDVLALKAHGFNEAVATLGTALTRDHIRKLKGYTGEAVVVFDSDTAGKGATIKSLPLFLNEGLASKVMVLPEGDDPDSFINKTGLEAFLKHLDDSVPMFEFYLDLKLSWRKRGVEGQIDILKEMLPVLSDLNSDSQRSIYIQRLSEKSGIGESIILDELKNIRAGRQVEGREETLKRKLSGARAKKQDDLHLLNLLIHFPDTAGSLINADCRLLLSDPVIVTIFDSIDRIYKREGKIVPSEILENLEGEPSKERYREAMLSPPFYSGDSVEQALKEFEAKVNRIKLSESLMKSRDDLEEKNRILMLKRNGQG
jgi:DNA primase